ncbi:hypothetical protein WR25_06688 [Diploscapter pachys]|uniref:ZP domain-containing protein n=1 Tax=Diploscapter pachys TaxID=2018661 RepID=A0A2A2K166_9BILA|nr:hypothetical protein WR25_06688 [Diploscapter pachys]
MAVDKPNVECGVDSIIVHVRTERPFRGRMYVEGESDKEGCVQGTKGPSDNPKFEIPIGACNMRRQRTLHPRGIFFSFTLITSFHPFFVTGMDRAFSVRCFFLESVRSLNAAVDIGQLTTQIVEQEFPLPICNYQLKEGSEGVTLRFAQVGQKVTHVWHCDQGASWVYGILIHSCFADDGHGNKFQLVDDKGCTTDPFLLPQIEYENHGISAFTHAQVFKYADKVQLYFTCTVQLCYKHDGGCEGVTPPRCDGRHHSGMPSTIQENRSPPSPHEPMHRPWQPSSPISNEIVDSPPPPDFVRLPQHLSTSREGLRLGEERPDEDQHGESEMSEGPGREFPEPRPGILKERFVTLPQRIDLPQVPLKDSPLNETETDTSDSPNDVIGQYTSAGPTIGSTDGKLNSNTTAGPIILNRKTTGSLVNDKKDLETDVSVDVIVLPEMEKDGKGKRRAIPAEIDDSQASPDDRFEAESNRQSTTRIKMLRIFAMAMLYYPLSIGLTFYQKWFIKKYQLPLMVATGHYIVKYLAAILIRWIYEKCYTKRVRVTWKDQLRWLAPIGICASLDIGLSNWALQYITISLYTMGKSTSILFIVAFSLFLKLERWRPVLGLEACLIAAGLYLFTWRAAQFDVIGLLLVELASASTGIRWTFSQLVMQREDHAVRHPLDMIIHVQPWMLIPIIPLVAFFEGHDLTYDNVTRINGEFQPLYILGLILFGGLLALSMELSEYLLLVNTSGITLNIFGLVKEVATLLMAHFFNNDQFTRVNVLGLALCLTGMSLHAFSRRRQRSRSALSPHEDRRNLLKTSEEEDESSPNSIDHVCSPIDTNSDNKTAEKGCTKSMSRPTSLVANYEPQEFEVIPDLGLRNDRVDFLLGTPINQVIALIRQTRSFQGIDLYYSRKDPYEKDVCIYLKNDGIRLYFEPLMQLLRLIEVDDLSRIILRYQGNVFSEPRAEVTMEQVGKYFGSTHPGAYDEKQRMYVQNWRGLSFCFPTDPCGNVEIAPGFGPNLRSLKFDSSSQPRLTRMYIFKGASLNKTEPVEMPLACYCGQNRTQLVELIRKDEQILGVRISFITQTDESPAKDDTELELVDLVKEIRFGDPVSSVLLALGAPSKVYYKSEDKMSIHEYSSKKRFCLQNVPHFFFNYLSMGIDVLFDFVTKQVIKIVLHTNLPGHYDFGIYNRCELSLKINDNAPPITTRTRQAEASECLLDPMVATSQEPIYIYRNSEDNPFNSCFCYGTNQVVIEFVENRNIATVTLYDADL